MKQRDAAEAEQATGQGRVGARRERERVRLQLAAVCDDWNELDASTPDNRANREIGVAP